MHSTARRAVASAGTGYVFAPGVGLVLAQLAWRQGTMYDIRRYAPAMFAGGGMAG